MLIISKIVDKIPSQFPVPSNPKLDIQFPPFLSGIIFIENECNLFYDAWRFQVLKKEK